MADYPNWFAQFAEGLFQQHLTKLKGLPIKALQIGAYTGDASLWLLDNVLTNPESILVDVDTWGGSDEKQHKDLDWDEVESVYLKKVEKWIASGVVIPVKTTSDEYFKSLPTGEKFDVIYIDGDHTAPSVIKDAVHAFEHLKIGGILIFDDYDWGVNDPDISAHQIPRTAITAFEAIYRSKILLIQKGGQAWFKKVKD